MSESTWTEGKVLLLGAKGMLGQELATVLSERLGTSAVDRLLCWDEPELDIRDEVAVRGALVEVRPAVVINAAAYTDVDGCESNERLAMAVNADGPRQLALACREIGAKLVHFSTDFVFDGGSDTPYQPDATARPLSVYGRSKWEGERGIEEAGCEHLTIRTSWLFGRHGRNFVEAILERAGAGEPLSVVDDQVGRPTLAADLAEAVLRLLDAGTTGTVHFANKGSCSWFEFAKKIVELADCDVSVDPITTAALARPARRPAYSVLGTESYEEATGHRPAPWQEGLARYLNVCESVADVSCARQEGEL